MKTKELFQAAGYEGTGGLMQSDPISRREIVRRLMPEVRERAEPVLRWELGTTAKLILCQFGRSHLLGFKSLPSEVNPYMAACNHFQRGKILED